MQTNGNFNPTEKLQDITYLQNQLTQLQKELSIKEKYSDDYSTIELVNIAKQINDIQKKIKSINKLKLFIFKW